jgi:hypothetical protein
MNTPPITKKQKLILLYLYKFRFLNTHQFQRLLKHKNANRTLSWLKDLIEKDYVRRFYERKSYSDSNRPAVYYLGPKARKIIMDKKDITAKDLEYIYSEPRRDKKFINRCVYIAEVYLFLLSQKEANNELSFFTKNDLKGYEYFPDPLPDAFIAVKGVSDTKRYFLDSFDDLTPPFVMRHRVRKYLEYAENNDWDENTDSAPFPFILMICPTERAKIHISKYANAVFEKSYEDKITLFVTTAKAILEKTQGNIWQKVE